MSARPPLSAPAVSLCLALLLSSPAFAQNPPSAAATTEASGSSLGWHFAGGCAAGAAGGLVLGSILPGLGNLIGAVFGCVFGGVSTAAAGAESTATDAP